MSKNFLWDRKGTAEVIGSVLSIVILIFFFSNVYLWHDANVSKMNDLQSQKMNSQIDVEYLPATRELIVKNTGGVDAVLSRLWINSNLDRGINQIYASFDADSAHRVVVKLGYPITIRLGTSDVTVNGRTYPLPNSYSFDEPNLTFRVITTRGNINSDFYAPPVT
jgi:hypothetical protein